MTQPSRKQHKLSGENAAGVMKISCSIFFVVLYTFTYFIEHNKNPSSSPIRSFLLSRAVLSSSSYNSTQFCELQHWQRGTKPACMSLSMFIVVAIIMHQKNRAGGVKRFTLLYSHPGLLTQQYNLLRVVDRIPFSLFGHIGHHNIITTSSLHYCTTSSCLALGSQQNCSRLLARLWWFTEFKFAPITNSLVWLSTLVQQYD